MGAYEASKAAVKVMTEVLSLECKPLNINVMLVVPAAVTTKIYKNFKDFQLPPDSLYTQFLHNIRERTAHGQVQKKSMSADEYAGIVIEKAVRRRPPYYVLAGENSWLYWFLLWLPRRWMLNILWKKFSRPAPKSKCE